METNSLGQSTAVQVGALTMTQAGVFVIDDGSGVIGADNEVLVGDFTRVSDNEQELVTRQRPMAPRNYSGPGRVVGWSVVQGLAPCGVGVQVLWLKSCWSAS